MVTGGSQGARSVNEFVCAFAQSATGRAALSAGNWQILHQTGKDAEQAVRGAYLAASVDAIAQAFSEQMGDWWGAADIAVARSGAGNVAEVWASRTPTLFLPYPFHKDDHQKHNARALVESGGAVLCTDHISPESNLRSHADTLSRLISDASKREAMRTSLATLGPADGAERVAKALWEAATGRK
jgi:UDP-N-acetylglucosamine--N-acetylmuramyl-(pentapeptide) pyrophosphoryl-undecaprenol N-acetylglucosamine transferase